ncbi:3-deoxy-D-manno-octulosonic acid transferase [Thalassotalea atypica]|uniref:3-deoxy-D-manno-octulosonic acid transferase n=1 Tax=Thalassotalea atypica TaxID=2054316 RepID=UPI00257430AF|nr:glycosyltransferase N-terminal domain-containing protein [Thalassotalea atypica]
MERLKWMLHKLLLKALNNSTQSVSIHGQINEDLSPTLYQWVFCSTIGELNACKSLITKIEEQGQLVLLTDRACYIETYQQAFPSAVVVCLYGHYSEAKQLIKKIPPKNFYLCEIPCLPNDAPCRLSYQLLRTAKQSGAKLYAVNAWLYEYEPSCRQDLIERTFFTKDYVQLFDLLLVQTEEVAKKLINKGANEKRVHVTGNMKFDALKDSSLADIKPKTKEVIKHFSKIDNKVFVAGNLSGENEYRLTIEAFLLMKEQLPTVKLILAPRHPEKKEQVDKVNEILSQHKLTFEQMSHIIVQPNINKDVLILDTFGDLKPCYSVADVTYVGKNHNVLEPLAFKKPVLVLPDWNTKYPSYPTYEIASSNNLLMYAKSVKELADSVLDIVTSQKSIEFQNNLIALTNKESVTKANIKLISDIH